MTDKLILTTAPAVEPVSLEEAKLHLRLDITADDTLVYSLIQAAREKCEEYTWRALITQTWDLFLDGFPSNAIKLPNPPLQSVTGVYYTPDGGAEQTVTSTDYIVDTRGEPGRIILATGKSWPGNSLTPTNGVRVRFVCGYGAAGANVPQKLRQGMLLLIGHLYENREAVFMGRTAPVMLPFGVQMLWQREVW